MGRRIGQAGGLSVDKIEQIMVLTEKGLYRSEIADALGVSKWTIWSYQKKYELI